jgi:hypothetical protein
MAYWSTISYLVYYECRPPSWRTNDLWTPSFWNNLWVTDCSLNVVIVVLDWGFLPFPTSGSFPFLSKALLVLSRLWNMKHASELTKKKLLRDRLFFISSYGMSLCSRTAQSQIDHISLSSSSQGVRSLLNPFWPRSSRRLVEGLPHFLDARGLYF